MLEPSYVTCTKEKMSWALQYEDIAPTNFLAPSSCGSDTHFSNFTQTRTKKARSVTVSIKYLLIILRKTSGCATTKLL